MRYPTPGVVVITGGSPSLRRSRPMVTVTGQAADRGLAPGHHRPARPAAEPWQGLAVLAAWAGGALLAGGLLRLRDA